MNKYDIARERRAKIIPLCDGVKTSKEIAIELGESQKYVQETMNKLDLPRRKRGSATGVLNGSYRHGRKIDKDGYVLVSAPIGHPYARMRKNRLTGIIYEHRLLMEKKIGRYLLPQETVDHIDGLRLHNSLDNLRLFDCNSEHLKKTISGCVPNWSKDGHMKMSLSNKNRKEIPQINTYLEKKKSGDARLIQILLAMLKLGKDSPYLLGTSHHLKKAQLSDFSHTNLKRALDDLYRKYE